MPAGLSHAFRYDAILADDNIKKITGSKGLPVLICWFISQSGGLRYFGIETRVKNTPKIEKINPISAKLELSVAPAKAKVAKDMQYITIFSLPAG